MKTIIDMLGPGHDEDLTKMDFEKEVATKHQKDKLNEMKRSSSNENDDQFYIDNEYNNRNSSTQSTPLTTPPETPVKQIISNNNNNFDSKLKLKQQEVDNDDENLKENLKLKELSFEGKATSNHLKYILDITIAYPNSDPLDLGDICTGLRKPCQTNLLYRLYRSSEVSWFGKHRKSHCFSKNKENPIVFRKI